MNRRRFLLAPLLALLPTAVVASRAAPNYLKEDAVLSVIDWLTLRELEDRRLADRGHTFFIDARGADQESLKRLKAMLKRIDS